MSTEVSKEVLTSPRRYVEYWMNYNKVTVTASGSLKSSNGTPELSAMILDHHELVKAVNTKIRHNHLESGSETPPKLIKPITKTLLEYAWADFPATRHAAARAALIQKLTPYAGDNDEIAKWLKGIVKNPSELDEVVIKHFIWQVKRKMLGLPVVYHICPIFFGKQNGGKTTSIQKLISPAADVVLELGPDEATDQRAKAGFEKNYVCFFDEMANMARVEMESLKRLITSERLSYRPLHTNTVKTVEQNCSFIGASNKSLQEVIYDPTGLRRFYEFVCLDRCDFEVINSTDYTRLWAGIDGHLERGYLEPLLQNLQEHQTERVTEDEVSHFVRETGLQLPGPTKPMAAAALYNSYVVWRAQAGHAVKPALAINTFGARLATHKLNKSIKKINGYQRTIYEIPAASSVFNTQLTSIKGGVT